MRKSLLALGACLAVALGAAVAHAQPGGEGPRMGGGMGLARADSNGDGQITREEANAARARMFARLDANGDGFISEADRDARRQAAEQRRAERFARMDANRDGKVSQAEFNAAPHPGFDRIDANHNGVLERAELDAARAERRARHEERHAK
ncbi:MAG: hypothetical protein JNJ73_00145 [Hyphomonadaceae bacterium]|nr:hypothetical protein [Hyphomonadaceae bacterium]